MPVLTLDSSSQPLFQPGAGGGVTIINLSDTVTVYVATTPTVHDTDIPVGPLASMTFDASQWWYGSALNTTAQVAVGPGVTGYFLPASLANIGGSKVYVQAGAPSGTIPLNSVWFDTGNGSLQTWDGTAWVNEQFDAQNLIQAATILGTQIAAQTVTASNVANGTLTTAQLAAAAGILGTQIAAATVTGANIAANTIVAANIAANTITAAQLAAGIIYAGIVNGTTITGGSFDISDADGSILISGSQISFGNGSFISDSTSDQLVIGAGTPGTNAIEVLMPFSTSLVPVQPGTTFTEESWHTFTPSGGWSATGGYARYRLLVTGHVQVQFQISGGTITNGTTIWTAPSGYAPAAGTPLQYAPMIVVSGASAAQADTPQYRMSAAGALTISFCPTGTTEIAGNFTYSLI